jgi:predicted AAA+ superfamily ATPase
MAGHLFETFAVGEVLRSYMNAGKELRDVWFYRDSRKREIDIVIQEGRVLHPVEIKAATAPGAEAMANFSALKALNDYEVGTGAVICSTDRPYPLGEDVIAISPWEI